MKIVFIYGPPASGKLTVAKELSKMTGFKIFHNHLINDLVDVAYDLEDDEKEFWKLVNKYKKEILDLACKNNRNLILTFCFVKGMDDKYLKELINIIKKHNGKISFVHLVPEHKELFKRIVCESRKNYGKLKHSGKLKKVLKKHDFYTSVEYKPNLIIDNTKLSPKKVALKIKKYYKL